MPRTLVVSDSIVVRATPDEIYARVSDPALMGRWSPENLGTAGAPDGGPAVVGGTFVGRNKRGPFRWVTRCTVTAAEPGRPLRVEPGDELRREP